MQENSIIKANYNETMLKIIIAEVNWLLAYWNISKDYNDKFLNKYGNDFFDKTKEILKVKNLSNNTQEVIEISKPTNNYYIKFNYSDSTYQVELLRVGKENNEDYGYRLVSNKIHSPNIKILIDDYSKDKAKFKNIRTGEEDSKTRFFNPDNFSKEDIEQLYKDTMKPSWNKYKKENGYKEK